MAGEVIKKSADSTDSQCVSADIPRFPPLLVQVGTWTVTRQELKLLAFWDSTWKYVEILSQGKPSNNGWSVSLVT